MTQAQRRVRENSNLQFSQSQHWSTWKRAIVPLYDRTNTVNRHQNQEGFIWKYILYDGIYRNSVEFTNGELLDRTSQIESSMLEARAHGVAIMNHCKADSLGTAVMVIIKQT